MKKIIKLWKHSLLRKIFATEKTKDHAFLIFALLTGVSAGLVAVLLHRLTQFFIHLFGTDQAFTLKSFFFGGLSIALATYLITRFFPSASGSGIPGTSLSFTAFHGKIPFRDTLAKFMTTVLSLASGVSLGLEGPIVAISSGIGSFIGENMVMPTKRVKALLATGSAAGIAAAFNTPMAAVIFTLEEIVGDLNATKVLGPIIISTVVAAVTATFLNGNNSTFGDFYYKLNDSRELILYLLVGILAAFLGVLWVKTVLKFRKINKEKFKGKKIIFSLIVFLLIGILSHLNIHILGGGHHTITEILQSMISDWKVLIILFTLKFFVTALCYSTGVSGGLFMPILLMGACMGGVVGSLSLSFFPGSVQNIGAFALVGMGAYFAAVIRSPFTSIIMVFEMTRDYNIILPLMIANIVSYLISSNFLKGSIYDYISEQDGVHLPTIGEDHEILDNLVIEDAMNKAPYCLTSELPVLQAFKKVKNSPYSGFPVLKNGLLVGMISRNDLKAKCAKGLGEKAIQDVCTKTIVKVYPDQSLLLAFHKLKKYHISRIPIVSRINDKEIVGIITPEDIVNQFGYHIQEESSKSNPLS